MWRLRDTLPPRRGAAGRARELRRVRITPAPSAGYNMPVARRLHRCAALAALAVGITACGDSTGPRGSIDVTVSIVAQDEPVLSVGADSFPTIRCVIHARATASGPGKATWLDATLRFYVGTDRSHAIDSISVPGEVVQQAWGKPDIRSGETPEAGLALSANIPFAAGLLFHYRPEPGGGTKTTQLGFDCGPTLSRPALPPVLSGLAVEPPVAPLQPGDTLKLDYTATSEVGLWVTSISLTGPCVATWKLAEGLQYSVTRVVRLPIPITCSLGVPLGITVSTLDAAALSASRSIVPGITLVDHTPPRAQAFFYPPHGGGLADHPAGTYFVGDSLEFIFSAFDNYALRTLVWEVSPGGYRDSLVVTRQSVSPVIRLPIRAEWTSAPIQLRLYAHDAVSLTSDTLLPVCDSVRIDPSITRPTRLATVDGEVREIAIDQHRGLIYLMQSNQGRLAVLSATTMSVTAIVPLPGTPEDLDITAGGDSLLVVLYPRRLGVIDLRQTPFVVTLLPLTALDSTSVDGPSWHVRVAANGRAFVSIQRTVPAAPSLLEIDLGTGAQRMRTDAGDGGSVGDGLLARSDDGSLLLLNGGPALFQAYNAASDAFGARGSASLRGWLPAVDGTGRYVAMGLDIYDGALQLLRRVHSPAVGGVAISALSMDGAYLYQGLVWGIVRSRVSDGALLDRSPNPIGVNLLRLSPDGAALVIVESLYGPTSRIAIMDLR